MFAATAANMRLRHKDSAWSPASTPRNQHMNVLDRGAQTGAQTVIVRWWHAFCGGSDFISSITHHKIAVFCDHAAL